MSEDREVNLKLNENEEKIFHNVINWNSQIWNIGNHDLFKSILNNLEATNILSLNNHYEIELAYCNIIRYLDLAKPSHSESHFLTHLAGVLKFFGASLHDRKEFDVTGLTKVTTVDVAPDNKNDNKDIIAKSLNWWLCLPKSSQKHIIKHTIDYKVHHLKKYNYKLNLIFDRMNLNLLNIHKANVLPIYSRYEVSVLLLALDGYLNIHLDVPNNKDCSDQDKSDWIHLTFLIHKLSKASWDADDFARVNKNMLYLVRDSKKAEKE